MQLKLSYGRTETGIEKFYTETGDFIKKKNSSHRIKRLSGGVWKELIKTIRKKKTEHKHMMAYN